MSTEKQRFDRRLRERVYLREQGKSEEEIDQRMRDNPTWREVNDAHQWRRLGRNLDALSSGQRKMLAAAGRREQEQEEYRLKAKATGWTNNLSDYEQQVLIRLDMLIADVGHHEIPPRYKPYSGGGQKRYRKKRTKKKSRRRKRKTLKKKSRRRRR